MSLDDKLVLITGAAQRIGRTLALATARSGGNVVIHYGRSRAEAQSLCLEIESLGRQAYLLEGDLSDPTQVETLIPRANRHGPLYALINNASIFEPLTWETTSLEAWNRHLMVNLTAPFLLSQAFARSHPPGMNGRIINMLDWTSLRPSADHLPYRISKSAFAALTRSLAIGLAPGITVNGLALGAILPPINGTVKPEIIEKVPAGRWGTVEEVSQAMLFLLDGPAYITGEIIHLDGGRQLV